MPKRPPDDQFNESEAKRRFLEAIKAGLSTSPKPLKDKPKVRKSVAEKKPAK